MIVRYYLIMILSILMFFSCDNSDEITNDKEHTTEAMLSAIKSGDISKIKDAITNGADVNAKDEKGETVLMSVASANIINNTNTNSNRVRVLSSQVARQSQVAQQLPNNALNLPSVSPPPSNIVASLEQILNLINLLSSSNVDYNVQDNLGYTALHYAVLQRNIDVVKVLLNVHPSLNVNSNANVNIQDRDGDTPLHLAIITNNLEMVKLLIDCGADISIKNTLGLDALALAQSFGRNDIVNYISSTITPPNNSIPWTDLVPSTSTPPEPDNSIPWSTLTPSTPTQGTTAQPPQNGNNGNIAPCPTDAIQIRTVQDFLNISNNKNPLTNYCLVNDIDFGGQASVSISVFSGTFDGQNHSIKNYVSTTGGLFSLLLNAIVKNLKIENANIKGMDTVGGFADIIKYSLVDNVSSSGIVKGNSNVGGLIGESSYSSKITNSYTTGGVSGTYNTGGLVGVNSNSSIVNSYSDSASGGFRGVGGLVGNNADASSIINSYTTGSVNGNSSSFGGLVGINSGSIVDSHSISSVMGDIEVGGLVGTNYGSITSSFATGDVYATHSKVGGLVGDGYIHSTIKNSYATGSASVGSNSSFIYAGGLVGYNQGYIISSYAIGGAGGSGRIRSSEHAPSIGGLVGSNTQSQVITESYCSYRPLLPFIGDDRLVPMVSNNTLFPNQMPQGFDTSIWRMGADGYPDLISNPRS